MSLTVSIIGSFRKPSHYEIIKKAITEFKQAGLIVLSPKGSKIRESIDEFVIFESDETSLSPAEIQMITLDKIIHSDVVFVCNVDGYLGRTTCYEIGFCLSRGVPLYFLSMPLDLPIPIDESHILDIEDFCSLAINGLAERIDTRNTSPKMRRAMQNIWPELNENRQIVEQNRLMICGSMSFYGKMQLCQEFLMKHGIDVIIPKDEGDLPSDIDESSFLQFKKRVSTSYLKKIRDSSTEAILVFNEEKKGLENYIGANTFVEIAMAFAWNRKIYLLNDYYEPYRDELLAWECKCLNGNLNTLIQDWQDLNAAYLTENRPEQLSLF